MAQHVLHAPGGRMPFMIDQFLRRHPDVAAAIESAGAYLVVFSPVQEAEDFDQPFDPGALLERVTGALDEVERALPERAGWPLYVCHAVGMGLFQALWRRREEGVIFTLHPRRGGFLGFVEAGEGGALYMAPDGQESGGWDGPRELVLAELGRLIERGMEAR